MEVAPCLRQCLSLQQNLVISTSLRCLPMAHLQKSLMRAQCCHLGSCEVCLAFMTATQSIRSYRLSCGMPRRLASERSLSFAPPSYLCEGFDSALFLANFRIQ